MDDTIGSISNIAIDVFLHLDYKLAGAFYDNGVVFLYVQYNSNYFRATAVSCN